jgi:hypothetical protein
MVVGATIVVAPIVVAFVVSYVVVHIVPRPASGPGEWLWLILILATPWLVYSGARRLARRALPLAALLRMTLLFPDKAPSRVSVARRAGGTRALERQLEHDRLAGRQDEPVVAAEQILALAASLNRHDRRTRGHSERVRVLTDVIADQMKLPQADKDRLRWSALLHDIGKLSVPVDVLNKPGAPDAQELALLRRHPAEGARMTAALTEWLGPWARSIPEHHERFDGTGYPVGLAGQEISLGGRIVAVADSFETMTAVRSYKPAMPIEAARRELTDCAGTQFDPQIVRAFLEASLAKRSVIGAPLAALADLTRLGAFQSAGQVATGVGHFAAGAMVATGIGVATVIGVAHTGPHSGSTASAAASTHVRTGGDPTHDRTPPPRVPPTAHSAAPTTTSVPIPAVPPVPSSNATTATPATTTVPVVMPTPAPAAVPAPATVPETPYGLSVARGDGQVTLGWNAPTGDGGAVLTGYVVTPLIGGVPRPAITFASTTTVQTIGSLANGTPYTFTVAARNAVGTGDPSVPSPSVTPATLPGVPTGLSVVRGNGQVALGWTPPTGDGGSAVTGYVVTPFVGGAPHPSVVFASAATAQVVTGLVDGTTYTFTVAATNAVGLGNPSVRSAAVTPATVPDAPTSVSAVAGTGSASVSFVAPFDEGSSITGYTVTATDLTTPANGGQTATSSSGPLTVTGLTDGDSYSFTVTATNAVGVGPPSGPSAPITPATVPDAPSAVSATAGAQSASVSFVAPFDGGSPITGYTVTATDLTTPANGGQAVTGASGPVTVAGLTDGDAYTFTVAATNGVGTGAVSGPSAPVTATALGNSSLILANGTGQPGRVDKGDQIIVSFLTPPAPGLFCSSWSALSYPDLKGSNIVVTGGPTAGDDTIASVSVPSCVGGFHFGSVDLGQTGYFNQATTFPGSMIHWDGVNTLTITLGPPSPGTPTRMAPGTAVYTPDPALLVPGTIASATGPQF